MADLRRHSVDVPLSRTLVQLKRVRSLRDPTTNSLSKYASASANMIWETASSNGVMIDPSRSGHHHLIGEDGDLEGEATLGSERSFRAPNARTASYRKSSVVKIRGLNPPRNKQVHRVRQDGHRRSLDSSHSNHGSTRQWANAMADNVAEKTDEEEEGEVNSRERAAPTPPEKMADDDGVKMPGLSKFRNKSRAATSRAGAGSPCMSASEARSAGSRRTEETRVRSNDVVGSNFSGCGISYCWSGASRYRELYYDSDGPEQPLISPDETEAAFQDSVPYTETPRCLSQKFRPRCFSELVGLSVVAQSLLYSCFKGKVAPMYLFHGPRGTGKTSMARVFAAALNCLSVEEEQRPCGFCKECVILFSGRSRDVKELDAAKMDRLGRVKALLKSASRAPYSSRFKVFIIDECHLLQEDAWSAILKSLDEPCQHAVYIMITSDIDSLPRTSITYCQKFHFPKIKVADIVNRDAETMLDQLSLLGKKITISLVHELVGSVSDDELIELLDLALSSDTTNTVRRARELMASAVDPLQLVSQLANLIMDILSGRCQSAVTEISKSFLGRYALAEVGIKKLRHALKILSETEKQLRTSRNQATWVTVALLQFGTNECNLVAESNEMHAHSAAGYTDEWVSKCRRLKLENIWRRAIGKCQPRSAKSFLRKEGFLSSVHVTEELAIAEVGFSHPDHISRAEKMQSLIESALQNVLGCNVEIRFKLVPQPVRKDVRSKRKSFSLLSCSGRKQELSDSAVTDDDEVVRHGARETPSKGYSSSQQRSPFIIMQHADSKPTTVHGREDDARSTLTSNRSMTDDMTRTCSVQDQILMLLTVQEMTTYGSRIHGLARSCCAGGALNKPSNRCFVEA
ncbi:hypothetical protein GUJ93_ZPchr0014g46683 [Zizania palustris]|uniref:DNA-directed DNA polymerase n=1 Tax=Zizania palustris TaxID=103762 RepID=A0A8J5TG06_ZIZPA|nr:hypothetical protein GUJ93_ZPchr0014g46683 [Zizania palustris]